MVREHARDTIEPCDEIVSCGWVGFRDQIGFDLTGIVDGNRADDWSDEPY
jgi:hypothetical protein